MGWWVEVRIGPGGLHLQGQFFMAQSPVPSYQTFATQVPRVLQPYVASVSAQSPSGPATPEGDVVGYTAGQIFLEEGATSYTIWRFDGAVNTPNGWTATMTFRK